MRSMKEGRIKVLREMRNELKYRKDLMLTWLDDPIEPEVGEDAAWLDLLEMDLGFCLDVIDGILKEDRE